MEEEDEGDHRVGGVEEHPVGGVVEHRVGGVVDHRVHRKDPVGGDRECTWREARDPDNRDIWEREWGGERYDGIQGRRTKKLNNQEWLRNQMRSNLICI